MSRVTDMLELPGAVAAGVSSRKGLLNDFEGSLPDEYAELAARMCAANSITMRMQGRLLADLSGQPGWTAYVGWAMVGPELAMVAVDDAMCMLRIRETSFNQVIEAMRAAAGVEE